MRLVVYIDIDFLCCSMSRMLHSYFNLSTECTILMRSAGLASKEGLKSREKQDLHSSKCTDWGLRSQHYILSRPYLNLQRRTYSRGGGSQLSSAMVVCRRPISRIVIVKGLVKLT